MNLSQRRAEALLAVLALAGSLGCTRDRLLALLWPERDEHHARHSLRDALYATRSALGRSAVVGAGDVLRLDPALVTSDVQHFTDALASGRLTDAVAAYGGPLLDGFHLGAAPEFERWVDEERARLSQAYLDAIERLAEAAEDEGDWHRAAEWWTQAVTVDPFDSRIALRRIVGLARGGDRANAVMEGEKHLELLQAELDLEPDPSFLEELQRIRDGELGPAELLARPGGPADRVGELAAVAGESAGAERITRVEKLAGRKRLTDLGSEGGSAASLQANASGGRIRWHLWAAAAVVLASAALAVFTVRSGPPEAELPQLIHAENVTVALGQEREPSWSPDGRALAFQSNQSGNWDIWVTQLGTGQATNRTADSPSDELHPTWSPDGRWIAFFSRRDGGGYFVMPSVGGTARMIASWPPGEVYPTPARWSPDGKEIAYALGQRVGPWIEVLSVATGRSRRLPLPRQPVNGVLADMSWSPDGRWLAYRRAISDIAATSELWLTRTVDGESFRLTDGSHWDWSPTWSPDSRSLYFVSDRGGTPDLWAVHIGPNGSSLAAPRQVTSGIEMADAALSPNGRRLAYTKARKVRNVYRAPILPNRAATWADVIQLTFDEADYESVDVSADGRLLLSSDRSGNWDIYLLPSGGGGLQALTTDSALDAGPRWSPDGREVVFYSNRIGHREVWVMRIGGGAARQLTNGPSEKLYPAWSPDGSEVAVGDPNGGLLVVDVLSGATRHLAVQFRYGKPDWSPDGRWIAFNAVKDRGSNLWRIPASGGEPELLTGRTGWVPRWSPDGKWIYFVGLDGKGLNAQGRDVWALSVEGGDERPITALTGRRGRLGTMGLATDGRFVYFGWEDSREEIWVADLIPAAGG